MMAQRTQRMFRAFVRTLMAPEKDWASIVTTDCKYLVEHVLDQIPALSLSITKKSTVIVTKILRCHTDSISLDSMVCPNLLPSVLLAYSQSKDKASCPCLLWHPILADLQSFLSSIIYPFEQLFRKFQHSPNQRPLYCKLLPMRLWPNTNTVTGLHFSSTINKVLRNNFGHYIATFIKEL